MKHYLKTLTKYYDDVENGSKSFEVRFNDRNFQVGDLLVLQDLDGWESTGRELIKKVTYVLNNPDFCKDGYVILGITTEGSGKQIPKDCYLYDCIRDICDNEKNCKADCPRIVEALEKQAPKPVKPNKRIPGICKCPICKTELCDDKDLNYCPTCGQKLISSERHK